MTLVSSRRVSAVARRIALKVSSPLCAGWLRMSRTFLMQPMSRAPCSGDRDEGHSAGVPEGQLALKTCRTDAASHPGVNVDRVPASGHDTNRLLITSVVIENRPVRDVAAQYGVSES